jgi:hypothetical protein
VTVRSHVKRLDFEPIWKSCCVRSVLMGRLAGERQGAAAHLSLIAGPEDFLRGGAASGVKKMGAVADSDSGVAGGRKERVCEF